MRSQSGFDKMETAPDGAEEENEPDEQEAPEDWGKPEERVERTVKGMDMGFPVATMPQSNKYEIEFDNQRRTLLDAKAHK